MSDIGIGKVIKGEVIRDAVHVAVFTGYCAEEIRRGTEVSLTGVMAEDGAFEVSGSQAHWMRYVGIVDPFINHPKEIPAKSRFLVFLFPNTVTSLRHVYGHPALDKIGRKS